ncbi:MAG: DUF4367 domain-containing protein [Enterococcus sp.]|nr:DUF4367 domain-containing protein [Enterococcus sp.]
MKSWMVLFICLTGLSISSGKEIFASPQVQESATGRFTRYFDYDMNYFNEFAKTGRIPRSNIPKKKSVGLPAPLIEMKTKKELDARMGYPGKMPAQLPPHFLPKKMYYYYNDKKPLLAERTYENENGKKIVLRYSKSLKGKALSGNYEATESRKSLHVDRLTASLIQLDTGSLLCWSEKNVNYCLNFESKITAPAAKEILSLFNSGT